MKSRTRIIALFAGVAATLAAVVGSASAAPAQGTSTAATRSIRIWSDVDRKAAVDRIASAWGRARGVEVEVVEKGFGDIRDGVRTAQSANAPDVIVGAHDWIGQLAAMTAILSLMLRGGG